MYSSARVFPTRALNQMPSAAMPSQNAASPGIAAPINMDAMIAEEVETRVAKNKKHWMALTTEIVRVEIFALLQGGVGVCDPPPPPP